MHQFLGIIILHLKIVVNIVNTIGFGIYLWETVLGTGGPPSTTSTSFQVCRCYTGTLTPIAAVGPGCLDNHGIATGGTVNIGTSGVYTFIAPVSGTQQLFSLA